MLESRKSYESFDICRQYWPNCLDYFSKPTLFIRNDSVKEAEQKGKNTSLIYRTKQ